MTTKQVEKFLAELSENGLFFETKAVFCNIRGSVFFNTEKLTINPDGNIVEFDVPTISELPEQIYNWLKTICEEYELDFIVVAECGFIRFEHFPGQLCNDPGSLIHNIN